MLIITFLSSILIILLILKYKANAVKYREIENLPGPSIWDMINYYRKNWSEGILGYIPTLNKIYGPTVKVWVKPLKPIIITTDMEFVDRIYKSNNLFYTPAFGLLESLLKNGLATTKSRDLWKNDKLILTKALTPAYVSSRLELFNTKYDVFAKTINDSLGRNLDIEPLLYKIYAEFITESLNDPQINMTNQETEEYTKNRNKYMDLLLKKLNSPNMAGILHKFTENYRLSSEITEKIIQIAEELLRRHKNVPRHQREANNLIYAMIDSGIPDDRIIDNINTFIGAGFDTSVLPLALTLQELGKRPDLQQKVLDEILEVLGERPSNSITLNDLNKMTYLNCVIKESVRLFFPTPIIDRLLTEDVKIRNITIPKGSHVIFHVTEIMTSEENFQRANVFQPERFLPENRNIKEKKAFLSFGFGSKNCLGKTLACAAMKLFIARTVREFEICNVANNGEVQLKFEIVFKSVGGIPVMFKKRYCKF